MKPYQAEYTWHNFLNGEILNYKVIILDHDDGQAIGFEIAAPQTMGKYTIEDLHFIGFVDLGET